VETKGKEGRGRGQEWEEKKSVEREEERRTVEREAEALVSSFQVARRLVYICVYVCSGRMRVRGNTLQHTAAHCNTLQHTATHCDTL